MKTQKIADLLNESDNQSSKFATRKWYIVNDQMAKVQPLMLGQRLLNQIFVINQKHIFL